MMLKAQVTIFLTFMVLVGYFIYANNTTIEISSKVEGEIIPFGNIRKIQNLEGGIINKIYVKEGMKVKEGEVLLDLEMIISESEVGEINSRLAFLEIEINFLKTILNEQKSFENIKTNKKYPKIFEASKIQYNSTQSKINTKLKIEESKIINFERTKKLLKNKIESKNKSIEIVNDQIQISEDLLKENITSKIEHLDLIKERQYIITDIDDIEKEIGLITSQQMNIKLQIESIKKEYLANMSEKFQAYIEERSKYNNRLKRYQDKLLRQVIKSPISGIIQEIYFFTQGGVVKPGEKIMTIVPQDEQLIVEAKLPVVDIGYINLLQDVTIRLQGNEGFAYAPINGNISFISPDTTLDDNGKPFYIIHIKTDEKKFHNKNSSYLLYPGLIVDCNVIVGKRTLIENILIPFKRFRNSSFTENVWFHK